MKLDIKTSWYPETDIGNVCLALKLCTMHEQSAKSNGVKRLRMQAHSAKPKGAMNL